MALLGIDTGGTYTDAVVYDDTSATVLGSAKSPTTHHDLSIGIAGAVDAVLTRTGVPGDDIELVSLSTTLATNALVEGTGGSVACVLIGFDISILDRAGLREALAGDPVILVAGGHDTHGGELAPLGLDSLAAALADLDDRVEAYAITSQFSVRNPGHELAARELIRRGTARPVTCSHELSAKLNGPRRAVTAVLNARLVSIIDRLVTNVEHTLAARRITAPLMVVRGDGSLVSASFVRERPIETILSGPASSLVGAAHLTGLSDAVVSDIGGTTTDIAVLRRGTPVVRDDGAVVGNHHTMVTAVAMHTHGLGGDSQLHHDERAVGPSIRIGPRRVVPLGLLAVTAPDVVAAMLDRQLRATSPDPLDGIVVLARPEHHQFAPPTGVEAEIIDRLTNGPVAALDLATSSPERRALDRLVGRSAVRLAAFTPTDACHVLGREAHLDQVIAEQAARLFARRRDRLGKPLAGDPSEMARLVVDAVVRRSAEAVLAAAFDHDGLPASTVATALVQRSLDRQHDVVDLGIALDAPLVGLGAAARTYAPPAAELLRARVVLPEHHDVANAIGAVVGRVRITIECTITAPTEGQFLVHLPDGSWPTTSLDEAQARASAALTTSLDEAMRSAGATDYETHRKWSQRSADLGGTELFVEGVLRLTASGRPDVDRVG